MVNKSFGITPVPDSTRFQDVKPGDWFGGQVEAAAAYGYVTGNPDGTFSPYRPITREQAAAMLVRVFGFSKLATEAEQDAVFPGEVLDLARVACTAAVGPGEDQGDTGEHRDGHPEIPERRVDPVLQQ